MVEDEKAQDADYYSRCEKSGSVSGKVEAKSTQVDACCTQTQVCSNQAFYFSGYVTSHHQQPGFVILGLHSIQLLC